MNHDSEIKVSWQGYAVVCPCGWSEPPSSKRSQAKRVIERHVQKAEAHRYWWVCCGGEVSAPFETKANALHSIGASKATRTAPGTYAVGDVVITTDPDSL